MNKIISAWFIITHYFYYNLYIDRYDDITIICAMNTIKNIHHCILTNHGYKIYKNKYLQINRFYEGFANVCSYKNDGYIDKTGVEVVTCKYNYVDAKLMLEKYKSNQIRKQKLLSIL